MSDLTFTVDEILGALKHRWPEKFPADAEFQPRVHWRPGDRNGALNKKNANGVRVSGMYVVRVQHPKGSKVTRPKRRTTPG